MSSENTTEERCTTTTIAEPILGGREGGREGGGKKRGREGGKKQDITENITSRIKFQNSKVASVVC